MKKLIPIIVLILFCTNIILTSCGSNQASDNAGQTVSETNNTESNAIPLSDIEIQQMYSDPDAFKGREIPV